MAYPTVVMESPVSRELRAIAPSWSTPQILEALLAALKGDGPALATTEIPIKSVSSNVALVVTTSGSTGAPKSVALSAKSLITNARATHKYLDAKIGERWSLLLPTNHVAGINVLIRSIELGTEPVGLSGQADYSAIVPTQLHRALEGDEQLLGHLRECKAVLVGGGPLDSELRDRAEKAGITVTATYGMTESCGGVVYDGLPLEGVEVKIVDDRIALKGPQIALGYLGEEFPTIDGFFLTSDLGRMKDGRLEVIGRGDDQIISGGEKISLGAIERFLQERLANPEIIAFGRPDSEWGERLCIATTQDFELSEISSLLKSQFGSHAAPKELLKLDSIPYLSIGKPDRRRLADANS